MSHVYLIFVACGSHLCLILCLIFVSCVSRLCPILCLMCVPSCVSCVSHVCLMCVSCVSHLCFVCVCVCNVCRDVNLLVPSVPFVYSYHILYFFAGGRGISRCGLCQRSSTLDDQENVPALYYIYIVPPLGAFKTQLGGTYTLSLLVCTVNVYCDYTFY